MEVLYYYQSEPLEYFLNCHVLCMAPNIPQKVQNIKTHLSLKAHSLFQRYRQELEREKEGISLSGQKSSLNLGHSNCYHMPQPGYPHTLSFQYWKFSYGGMGHFIYNHSGIVFSGSKSLLFNGKQLNNKIFCKNILILKSKKTVHKFQHLVS